MPGQTIEDIAARRGGLPREGDRAAPGGRGQALRDRQLPGRLGDDDAWPRSGPSCSGRSSSPARRSPTGPACTASTRCATRGGLLGGTWLTALTGDLGAGMFDGAWLVQNFENQNPANTLWTKQYNL